MDYSIKKPKSVPDTEFSMVFLQGMVDRMGVSYFKYGPVAEAKGKINEIESLKIRLNKYLETGNTEYLMDVANFAMIEFMQPSHPRAYFRPTDARESPGRVWQPDEFDGSVETSQRSNDLGVQ